ncbi:protein kinase [Burkholderia sp. FXe9]|nr:protein kinase [Burkholderia sp. FXe9]
MTRARAVRHARESQQPAAPFAPLAGKRHYRLGALLGEGGSGVVFRATCDETGQDVAIKLMRDDVARTEAERARQRMRFRRETSLCEALRHPNIVALLDKGKRPTGGCLPYSNACRAGPCATGSRWRGRCRPSIRDG